MRCRVGAVTGDGDGDGDESGGLKGGAFETTLTYLPMQIGIVRVRICRFGAPNRRAGLLILQRACR